MRPTTTTMLQQNNNNNYPCLDVSGSPRDVLQKCSRGSLLFPSRLELGLGDLPLIRGLRAWALCSKNRKRAGLLGGAQAPVAPPTAPAPCPRPADVFPAGELGQMSYGLPLGLDGRQAGIGALGLDARQASIGALVTVATLKASEGGGQTQTRCLFLRTEEGSCLYSTAQPGVCSLDMGPGASPTGPSNLVGGWLRGKVGGGGGGGGRDAPAGRRDNGQTPVGQTGANRVRMRSGRRWRKSQNAAGSGQERTGPNRERRVKEERSGNLIVEEGQEDRHKGGSPNNSQDGKHSPNNSLHGKHSPNNSLHGKHSPNNSLHGKHSPNNSLHGKHSPNNILHGKHSPNNSLHGKHSPNNSLHGKPSPNNSQHGKHSPSNSLHGKHSPNNSLNSSSSRQEEGGADRSPTRSHAAQPEPGCPGRGGQEGCETHEGPGGDGVVLDGVSSEVEGIKQEEEERGALSGLKSGVSSPVMSDCDPEPRGDGDIGRERDEDNGETWEALQTQSPRGKDLDTEEDEGNANAHARERDITSGVMKTQTGGCGINNHTGQSSVTSCCIFRHDGDDDDDENTGETETSSCSTTPTETSGGRVEGYNGLVDHMVLDGESERLAGSEERTERSDGWTPIRSSGFEEGRLFPPALLSSVPVPHSPADTSEPSTPVGGSSATPDDITPWDQEERGKDTSDGERSSNNNNKEEDEEEEHLERDGPATGSTGIVGEDELDARFTIHQSSLAAVDEGELCVEGKLLKVADTVKATLTELVVELSTDTEDSQSTSEEVRGPCEQPGETLCEIREEEERDGQVEGRSTASPPLRQVEGQSTASPLHGQVDGGVDACDRGVFGTAAGEGDLTRGEEAESRGAEWNEKGAEVKEEHVEEKGKLEREGDNLVDRTAEERNGTVAIRREDHGDALQDGIKKDDVEECHADEKLHEWPGGEEESRREVSRDRMTKEDRRTQEPAEERRREDTWVPPLADPLLGETGGERGRTGEACSFNSLCPSAAIAAAACTEPALPRGPANPAPPCPPAGAMATLGLPCLEVGGARAAEREGKGGSEGGGGGGGGGDRVLLASPEEQGQERKRERRSTVATEQERGRQEEPERREEDEFGMFVQAEEESAWSEGFAVSASVPCGNRESAALGSHGTADESTYWTSSWTDSSFHHSEDTWTAFPHDSLDEGRDAVGQWWPVNAAEERRDRPSTNQNLTTVFAEAFPLLVPSCCDSDTIPTLAQLLREDPNCSRTSQDRGLLDSFHDLNKMIGQRYKRANGVSRDLLLQSLHLDRTYTDSRTGPWTANHRLSPGLPSSNQHAPTAAAKRRLSYDCNKNIME